MIPTFIEIQNILNTLPIGYYIGRNVPVKLTNESSSYYMAMQDEIHISYQMLADVMTKIENKLDKQNIECLVRTLLYHEISHAFITPVNFQMDDVLNVFEDERIESICRTYYKGVNFKQLLMLINDWDGYTEPVHKDAFSVWYSLFRYHRGKPEYIKKAVLLLQKYNTLNRSSSRFECAKCNNEIHEFYNEILDNFYEEQNKKQKEQTDDNANDTNNSDDSDNNNNINNANNMNNSNANNSNSENDNNVNINEVLNKIIATQLDEMFDRNLNLTSDNVKAIFENAQTFVDKDVQEKLTNIIINAKKVTKANASAINAYSGVFDPRSVVRQDYKWFVQQNRQGNIKQFSKIKLNLFIDCSGSFYNSETTVNKILFALSKIEKLDQNFSFDVVAMNVNFKLKDKDKRQITCIGGNTIDAYANDIIKKVQERNSENYNIVLFDGDAFSYDNHSKNHKNFGFFNMQNTVMILDESNKCYAEKYCKNTRRIYTNDYTTELFNQICNALTFLVR